MLARSASLHWGSQSPCVVIMLVYFEIGHVCGVEYAAGLDGTKGTQHGLCLRRKVQSHGTQINFCNRSVHCLLHHSSAGLGWLLELAPLLRIHCNEVLIIHVYF